MIKKLATWASIAFVIWFVITAPVSAAHIVHDIAAGLAVAANGVSKFLTSI